MQTVKGKLIQAKAMQQRRVKEDTSMPQFIFTVKSPHNMIQTTKTCKLVIQMPLYTENGCLLGCCTVETGNY
jgi:hypothetical protein